MFAIVEIAGLQYKVEQDQKLFVNRLKGEVGDKLSFDKVLMTVNGAITLGAPAIKDVLVDVEILNHLKADKVIVFKKKRRKGYTKKNGHRQSLTQIQITGITGFDSKDSAKKETVKAAPKAKKEAVEKKVEDKPEIETAD
ncbi:50S ribosomal protein L21 [Frigoriflavimonas asaccharolytica]|uniref:Large ribosomal subunit protein bL21 n=1 Tax=Frigoriflavimonas asaccharolytica TaxID=2735899 RepID=A0A8J8K3W9_9FLAO|nr:large subunit ribosomal protein L21 [Frigoriflavimonas asaccharolytica]